MTRIVSTYHAKSWDDSTAEWNGDEPHPALATVDMATGETEWQPVGSFVDAEADAAVGSVEQREVFERISICFSKIPQGFAKRLSNCSGVCHRIQSREGKKSWEKLCFP